MVYLIPLSLTAFGAYYFDIKKNKRGERILYNFLFIYLVFLIGFRFEVGGDTLMYMQDYIWRVDITEWQFSWTDYYEPLYTLLCSLSKTVGDDFVYDSNSFPYTSYSNPSYTKATISTDQRGTKRPAWELFYGYCKAKGISSIYSGKWAEQMRPDGGGGNYGPNSGGFDQLGFGTLMYYRE